jgi:PleD family two-component response regulator/DNA-directed RNA polymerase subunit RPC12/RpoP
MNIGTNNKVLIIQPDKQVREMLVEVFKKANFDVLEAGDGAEGFFRANNQDKLDVVLTALNMPRIDALEFIKRQKENTVLANVPVVIYDNLNSEEEKELALTSGAKDFIAKGAASPAEIVQRVSRVMQQGEYNLQIDPYALDAQQFIEDYHLGKNFECMNCGTPLAAKVRSYKGRELTAKIVCPSCGKEYL